MIATEKANVLVYSSDFLNDASDFSLDWVLVSLFVRRIWFFFEDR